MVETECMAADDDTRLAQLRRAAYGPGATPLPHQLAELAALERESRTDRAVLPDAGEAGDRPADLGVAPDGRADGGVNSRADDSAGDSNGDSADGADGRATGVLRASSNVSHRASGLRRPWAVLASAVVATALIASVAGYAVGSYRPTDTAAAAASTARIDEAVGTTAWLDGATQASDWDVGSARLLGSVDDLSVLVTTKRDGEQWCGVLVRSGEFVSHQESCRRSAAGVVGLQVGTGPTVQVERAVDGTFSFGSSARDVASFLDGPLVVARDLLVNTLGWQQDEVIPGGMFEGVSVWGRVEQNGAMCITFVQSALREVADPACGIREDATLSGVFFEVGASAGSARVDFTVQRIGNQLVTRAEIRE